MTSPTQRTIAELKKLGATVQIVERWCAFSKRRIDLFGFIDILALMGPNTVGIQCTSGTNHSQRKAKIVAEPKALAWIEAGNLIEIWSWAKRGARGKRKTWVCRKEEITREDFA